MDMRKVTREIRLEKWAEILRERQASGMSITAWCEANGVDRQRYFYYQRKLREKTCESLAIQEEGPTVNFAEYRGKAIVASSSTEPSRKVSLVLHLEFGRLEIHRGADRETIENTLLALKKLC